MPKPLSQVKAGRVTVAGVAWTPAKGIAKVEVSADNGPWQKATLAASGASTPGGNGCGAGTPDPGCTTSGPGHR